MHLKMILLSHWNLNNKIPFSQSFNQIFIISYTLTTTEMIRSHPKAATNKMNNSRDRKQAHTKVLTDTSKKLAIKLEFRNQGNKTKKKNIEKENIVM